MSLTEDYRAIRQRLMNPPNAWKSDKTERDTMAQQAEKRRRADIAQKLIAEYERRIQKWLDDENAKLPAEPKTPDEVAISDIVDIVSEYYGIHKVQICSRRRDAEIVRPRQVIMYLAKQHTLASLPRISKEIGGRDHTTALSAIRKIARLISEDDAKLIADIAALRTRLGVS
jgi:chromosomal replication initiation ATPase DnaA